MFTGDLSDFSLGEILQFLTSTSRSGVLKVHCDGSTAGIALLGGGVGLALLDLDGVGGLAARMRRSGAIDVEQMQSIAGRTDIDAIAKATELAAEASDTAGAADVFVEHTYETLGWLTHLEQATFTFERRDQLDAWPFAAVELDDVLAEVDERAERWAQLPEAVGDLTLVCSLRPEIDDAEVILTADQWRTIALVDGRRTIGDLVELSGVGHLETCTHINDLVDNGLIELVAAGQPSTLAALLGGLGVEHALLPAQPHGLNGAQPPAAPSVLQIAPDPADDATANAEVSDTDGYAEAGEVADAGEDSETSEDSGIFDGDQVADVEPASDLDDEVESGGANRSLLTRLLGGAGETT